MDKRRGALIGGGVVVLLALAGAVVWFGPLQGGDDGPDRPDLGRDGAAWTAAEAFASAWAGRELDAIPATAASGNVGDETIVTTLGLGPSVGAAPTSVEVTALRLVEPAPDADAEDPTSSTGPDEEVDERPRVEADLSITWTFDEGRSWTYDSAVELVEDVAVEGAEPRWLVDWTRSVVHPRLATGERLESVRVVPSRGDVVAGDGEPIVGLRPVVIVGIQPGRAADPAEAARQVAALVDVDAEALVARVEAAPADRFVEVVTLRRDVYDGLRDQLQPIPGAVFREDELPLAPSRTFARALLGTVGPATEEAAAASEGRVLPGELIGLSGLQAAQDETLGGRAGISVRVVPDPVAGGEPRVLHDVPAENGETLTLTLDTRVQLIADQVMAGAPAASALVAIRPSTGDVLAVANGPTGADGYNRAMVGAYPPGSTFKVATTLAMLDGGLTPDEVVSCPPTVIVGKEFRNAGGGSLGDVPFRTNFAESCNTAFVTRSQAITSQQLSDTAALLGFRPIDLGVPLREASVPVTDSATEHAAQSIGQGRVESSPFSVALMTASVAAGRSITPRLIIDPDAPAPEPGIVLAEGSIADLRSMMRSVVTDGTGSALAGAPGGEVFGKTGTAEFGTESPPQTHAWFTGWQGDVAFAVLVEGGASGGGVAAPLAAEFVRLLAEG